MDELVKLLRCLKYGSCPDCPMWYSEEVEPNLWRERCAAIDAADAIEDLICELADEHNARLDAESRQRWIPVADRKPKTDDLVIVAIHDDSGDTPYDVTNVGFYLDVFPLGIWVVENERCNYVTHWQPLPEPPKEET